MKNLENVAVAVVQMANAVDGTDSPKKNFNKHSQSTKKVYLGRKNESRNLYNGKLWLLPRS